ncbi:transcriptional regulatory protein AlgP-like [Solenopsis invicta]|uniref:transcriptional regulatory protein AlgP-like n=1 Tax=Solenopsis invicta TaxID=13686 RepID=UPI00193D1A41|nr:transcriptional regulatory protein AlgP-like [Solenopsis invicta]
MEAILDALLDVPSNDAEFDGLWKRMMETTPSAPGLFPSPPQRPTGPSADQNTATAADRPTSINSPLVTTNSPAPAKPSRAKPVLAIRAPSQGLIREAKPAKRLTARPAPKRPPPVIGVRIQRSSAANAKKWAALMAEPSLPSNGSQHRGNPQQPAPPRRRPAPAEQRKKTLVALFGDPLSDLEEESASRTPATTSCEPSPLPAAKPGQPVRPRTADPQAHAITKASRKIADPALPPRVRSTETKGTSGPAPCGNATEAPTRDTTTKFPAGAPPDNVTQGTATTATAPNNDGETPTPAQPTRRTGNRPDRPPMPVRVTEDLTVYVPYYAATVSRVYKVRLANRRFTLRFSRDGQCHYVREFPA